MAFLLPFREAAPTKNVFPTVATAEAHEQAHAALSSRSPQGDCAR